MTDAYRLPRYKPAKSVIALAWACLPAIFVSSAAPKLPPSAKCPKQSLQILLRPTCCYIPFQLPSLCSCSSLCQVCAVPTPPSQIQSHHQGAIQMPPPLGSLPDFWQLPPRLYGSTAFHPQSIIHVLLNSLGICVLSYLLRDSQR